MTDATPPIQPALSDEEWTQWRFEPLSAAGLIVHDDGDGIEFVARDGSGTMLEKYKLAHWSPNDHAGIIALLNHGLPSDDPRKITREWIEDINEAGNILGQLARETDNDRERLALIDHQFRLVEIRDALASYLPPETP